MRFLPALILSLTLSACSMTPVQPPNLRAKPTTCFLTLPTTLKTLPPQWGTLAPAIKAKTLLDLHADDGAAYAQALTQLRDCQAWIQDSR